MKLKKNLIIALAAICLVSFEGYPGEWKPFKELGKELKKKGKDKLDGLKKKGENAIGGAINSTTDGAQGTSGSTTSNANGPRVGRTVGDHETSSAISGTSYQKTNQEEAWGDINAVPNPEDYTVPAGLAGLHMSTNHSAYANLRNYSRAPKTTPSTVHLVLDNHSPSFSNFYDGVAYIYSNGRGFYINERGEVLFDSNALESDIDKMPRFYNGVVLEQPDIHSKNNKVLLRDKRGNIIKEFKSNQCSNFVDGVAAICISTTGGLHGFEIKYIDTKGNFIFPELTISLKGSFMGKDLNTLVRNLSEGLAAFAKYDEKNNTYLWGFRDASGNVVIEPKFAGVKDFHDGMAAFYEPGQRYKDGKWGFINKSGNVAIPASFTNMPSDFDSGYARVLTKNDDAYIIDKRGNKIKGPFGHDNYDKEKGEIFISPFFNGYAIMGWIENFSDDESYPIYEKVYGIVDTHFNKKCWTDRNAFSGITNSTPIAVNDGRLYVDNDGIWGTQRISCLDPTNMDVLTMNLANPFVNGYSRYKSTRADTPSGYINDKNEFVITFEENEF